MTANKLAELIAQEFKARIDSPDVPNASVYVDVRIVEEACIDGYFNLVRIAEGLLENIKND